MHLFHYKGGAEVTTMSKQLPFLPPTDCRNGGRRNVRNPTMMDLDEAGTNNSARAHLHLPTPTTLVAALSLNMGYTRHSSFYGNGMHLPTPTSIVANTGRNRSSSFNGNGMSQRTESQGRCRRLLQILDEAIEILDIDQVYVRQGGSSRDSKHQPHNEYRQ